MPASSERPEERDRPSGSHKGSDLDEGRMMRWRRLPAGKERDKASPRPEARSGSTEVPRHLTQIALRFSNVAK
jgi:hypothetical protein